MNKFLYIILLFPSFWAQGQIITTVDSIGCYDVNGVVFDSHGNLFFTTLLGNQVKKMDTNYITSVVAGTGAAGFSGDGDSAIYAKLNQPLGIAVDSLDNIYFADIGNNRIRKIDISTGIISTIAGDSSYGFSGDGVPASATSLYDPNGICLDKSGNLYIADTRNYRIRKVNTSGVISTYAGNGTQGSGGDGGIATVATCYPATGMAIDNLGNLYFTQIITYPTIRKVNSAGIISTIAGDTISYTYNGDGIPATEACLDPLWLTLENDNLLTISDGNNRIRLIDSLGIIHTIAGDGILGNYGDGGPATDAEFFANTGVVFDKCSNLFIGQVNNPRIRKVTFDSTCDPYTTKAQSIIYTNSITIYPNPASSILHIDGVESASKYELFNILGIIEQSGILQKGSNELPISTLPPGMYLLQLTDEQGCKTMKKVVKE